MKISGKIIPPKVLLEEAHALATRGAMEEASARYQACIQAYLDKGLPLRALAAAKAARSALGDKPKIQALLIRIYTSLGLSGDAQKEYHTGAAMIAKDAIPLLRGLDQMEALDFLDIMELMPVKRGAWILKQGEKGEDIYLVASGSYEVVRDRERLAVMRTGDIFGEIGFFHHATRTASVRALDDGELIRLPAEPLRNLCRTYPSVAHALEQLYTARVIKKASEDLALKPADLTGIRQLHFEKGKEITSLDGISVVKHGVVEVDYNEHGLNRKRFLGPGSVFKPTTDRVRANTDVDLILAHPDITGRRDVA